MKINKFYWSIINNYFLILIFIKLTKEDIFNNPLLISENANPVVIRGSSGSYYIYTSGEHITIKTTGEIQSKTFPTYNAPYIFISDESTTNYYIFSSSAWYKITLGSNSYQTLSKPLITYPTSSTFIGSISETKNDGSFLIGCLCSIATNEKIIYGKNGNYNIVFSFLIKQTTYNIEIGNSEIEERMACKKIQSGQYLCAIIYGYLVHVYLFSHLRKTFSECQMNMNLESDLNNVFNQHTNIEMYDTDITNKKLICAKNINNYNIECVIVTVTINFISGIFSCSQTQSIDISNILLKFPTKSSSKEECFFKLFISEYLFCCGDNDLIKCGRFFTNYTLITTFNLDFPGKNIKLNFFSDQKTYGNIFIYNENSGNKVYEYSIFLPECKNLNYTIIVYHSINEEKSENEKTNLNDLFTRKTNTDYYFVFEFLPDDYGNFLINEEKISYENNNTKILLENENAYYLDFISNTENVTENLQIPFKIMLKETYSAKCIINLNILPCYESCSQCSKPKSESSNENHNCLENKCKKGYYSSPLTITNCFSEKEKQINWYLNTTTKRFSLCDNNCLSCYGPNSDNCLTCFTTNLAYFFNGKCLNECPEGTYPVLQTSNYYKCEDCYLNCKTCSEKGNDDDMKCDSCNDNDIIYNNNCYKEYNSEQKTFYKYGTNGEITSCYELLNYYIEENTYECISSMPNVGYFLVNSSTGLFAKCHSDCKTCSRKNNELSSNCDSCNNEDLYLLNGNCVNNCSEGYFPSVSNSVNICQKCYQNCLICSEKENYNDINQIINMNCLKCKREDEYIKIDSNCFPILTYSDEKIIFDITELNTGEIQKTCLSYGKAIIFGEYKCISKPVNYYYVLNNEENTGLIKKCDNSCATCENGRNDLTCDTNCLTCESGYFKTEDSNTNCILENLIPENYLKNNSDNIYYKCHPNCKKCNDFYNEENDDMNCEKCKTNFYFVYETNNCYSMNFINENNYFLSEEDNQFHKCYFSCSKCSKKELDKEHHNCDACLQEYYFEDNTNNCYNISFLEKGYYLRNENGNFVFKKCYEKCQTCNNTFINNDMNCISCKDNYYKINGTNNCYNETLIEQGYYLKNNYFYPCEENCKTCSNSKTIINNILSNNCISCDNTKGLYLTSNLKNCEKESFKENGYYLDIDSNNSSIKIFYKCYFSCSLCEQGKQFSNLTNKDNHNCLKCKENFYPLKNDINPNNC